MTMWAIVHKEAIDTLRDRRTLFSSLAYALLGPIVIAFVVNMLAASGREGALVPVALCGPGSAPGLVEHLSASGLTFTKDAKVCLNVPADYAQRIEEGRTPRVVVSADLNLHGATARKLEVEIRAFANKLASQRLMARGIAPNITTPIEIELQNRSAISRQAETISRMLIIFFVCAPFFVGLAAAADMTAGERERRSLEPLLAQPVGAFAVVFGKWVIGTALAAAGTAVCIGAGLLLLRNSALPELGVRVETNLEAALTAVVLLLPLCGMVAAFQLAIGLFAKSFKDAQSYLTLFSFTPLVAGFAATGEQAARWSSYPLAWELSALSGPLLSSTPSLPPFELIAGIEAAVVIAVLAFTARRLRSEAVLAQG